MRCLGRTETDRKITNEPWSSKQSLTEQRRPLFGVKGVVCPKKEKREQKFIKKVLTRAGIVRDIAYEPHAPLYSALNWTEVRRKIWGVITRDSNSTCLICPFKPSNLHIPFSSHLGKMNSPPFNLHKWFASRLGAGCKS